MNGSVKNLICAGYFVVGILSLLAGLEIDPDVITWSQNQKLVAEGMEQPISDVQVHEVHLVKQEIENTSCQSNI